MFGSGRVRLGARHVEIIDLPTERQTIIVAGTHGRSEPIFAHRPVATVLRLFYTRLVAIEPFPPPQVTCAHFHAINIYKRNSGAFKVGVRIEKIKKFTRTALTFGKRPSTTFCPPTVLRR